MILWPAFAPQQCRPTAVRFEGLVTKTVFLFLRSSLQLFSTLNPLTELKVKEVYNSQISRSDVRFLCVTFYAEDCC